MIIGVFIRYRFDWVDNCPAKRRELPDANSPRLADFLFGRKDAMGMFFFSRSPRKERKVKGILLVHFIDPSRICVIAITAFHAFVPARRHFAAPMQHTLFPNS